MHRCPQCGKMNRDCICAACGFDASKDYLRYPTLVEISRRDDLPVRQPQSPSKKKTYGNSRLLGLAAAATAVLAAVLLVIFLLPKTGYTYLLYVVDQENEEGCHVTISDPNVAAYNEGWGVNIFGEGNAVVLGDSISHGPRARLVNGNRIILEEQGANWIVYLVVWQGSEGTNLRIDSISSSDESVVKIRNIVDNSGTYSLSAVGEGTAELTVICGEEVIIYTVVCDFDMESMETNVPCRSLAMINSDEIVLDEEGASQQIDVMVLPENTTDKIVYVSSDETVVTVNEQGKVTAVGEGKAVITISCGDQVLKWTVMCDFSVGQNLPITGIIDAEIPLVIRRSPGYAGVAVGLYKVGAEVTILELKTVDGESWGRTDKGWIFMKRVKLVK